MSIFTLDERILMKFSSRVKMLSIFHISMRCWLRFKVSHQNQLFGVHNDCGVSQFKFLVSFRESALKTRIFSGLHFHYDDYSA